MITQFKIFENSNIDILRNKFWYIEGDMNYIVKVLRKFIEVYNLDENDYFYWLDYYVKSSKIGGSYENILGVYFGFEENSSSSQHYSVLNHKDLIDGKLSWNDCVYQGKLKIKDGKLFLDTLDKKLDEYNL